MKWGRLKKTQSNIDAVTFGILLDKYVLPTLLMVPFIYGWIISCDCPGKVSFHNSFKKILRKRKIPFL